MIARGCCIWGRMLVPNEALDGATLCPAGGVADPCAPTLGRLSSYPLPRLLGNFLYHYICVFRSSQQDRKWGRNDLAPLENRLGC